MGGQEIPILLFLLVMLGTAGILWFAFRKSLLKVSLLLTVICGCVFVSVFFLHSKEEAFRNGSDYQNADIDGGVKNFFADQRIMLLVPHQDDELNVLGGTIEEYIHYGSEVYVVYLTNGDFLTSSDKNPTETRYAEAIACLEKQGVAEDHVIFLGYGDKWQADGPHIYNAPSGEVVHSKAGFTTTYGSTSHPPYRDGVEYTIENLMMDMETVILEYRPDTIICCDYDEHQDHRALSMLFEKIMGRILRGGPTTILWFIRDMHTARHGTVFMISIISISSLPHVSAKDGLNLRLRIILGKIEFVFQFLPPDCPVLFWEADSITCSNVMILRGHV